MNKKELIEKINAIPWDEGVVVDTLEINRAGLIKLIEQFDEPQKVKVPQFVANWYEKHKYDFEFNMWDYVYRFDMQEDTSFKKWFNDPKTEPFKTLVNMHQFGYKVEKEKKYIVKIKGKIEENLLVYGWGINRYFFARSYNDSSKRGEHTRKELIEDGFGEVFNSPLFEVEEVTE